MPAVAHRRDRLAREVVERVAVGRDQVVERLDVPRARRLDQQQVVDADEVERRILAREAALHQLPHLGDHRQRHLDVDPGLLGEALRGRRQVLEDAPVLLHHAYGLRICVSSSWTQDGRADCASARSKTSGGAPCRARARRAPNHPVLDHRQRGHEIGVPAAPERAHALLDHRVRQVHREVRRRRVDDRARAVVRRDRPLERLGERGDLARLRDAADPADVEDRRSARRRARAGRGTPASPASVSPAATATRVARCTSASASGARRRAPDPRSRQVELVERARRCGTRPARPRARAARP